MVNINLKLIIILALVFPFLFIGCWDRTEVDTLAIVAGVGIDIIPGNEPILFTVQIINPSGMKESKQGGQQQPFIVKSGQGKSIVEAIRNLSADLPRRLYFEHNEAIILGKKFSESGIADVFDYFERNKEFRPTNYILVTDRTAKEVLDVKIDTENIPAKGIRGILARNTFTYPNNRSEFILGMRSIGASFVPLIRLADREKEINTKLVQAGNETGNNIKSSKEINIESTGVYKNYRLAGFLTVNESKGLLWLANKVKEDSVVVPYKTNDSQQEVTIDIVHGESSISPQITPNEIIMRIECKGRAILREAGNTGIEAEQKEIFRQLEQKTEQVLKKRVEKTIESAQKKFKADFIGFGNRIHDYDPVIWKGLKQDWNQNFSRIKYNVAFQIRIIDTGVVRDSVNELGRKE